jgi:hypothetical protein
MNIEIKFHITIVMGTTAFITSKLLILILS